MRTAKTEGRQMDVQEPPAGSSLAATTISLTTSVSNHDSDNRDQHSSCVQDYATEICFGNAGNDWLGARHDGILSNLNRKADAQICCLTTKLATVVLMLATLIAQGLS